MRFDHKNKYCNETQTKEEIDISVLKFYFYELSQNLNIDLEYFFPPTNSLTNSFFRSINKKYVALIQQSSAFMNEYHDILQHKFFPSCQEEILSKLKSLLKIWCNKIVLSKEGDLDNLILKIEESPKFKLPWTIVEAQRAAETSSLLFDNKLFYRIGNF